MTEPQLRYVLGQSERAARRLEIQDAHFAEVSELLLDELALRPWERVVELGCGAGSFSRRILKRLGDGAEVSLVAVDNGVRRWPGAAVGVGSPWGESCV